VKLNTKLKFQKFEKLRATDDHKRSKLTRRISPHFDGILLSLWSAWWNVSFGLSLFVEGACGLRHRHCVRKRGENSGWKALKIQTVIFVDSSWESSNLQAENLRIFKLRIVESSNWDSPNLQAEIYQTFFPLIPVQIPAKTSQLQPTCQHELRLKIPADHRLRHHKSN
jgi:hypothetical protein